MTRGFFVLEKSNKVVKAAILSSDSYLYEGYGCEILRHFLFGTAERFLDELRGSMTSEQERELLEIRPEWYRKTKRTRKGDVLAEYGYVLRNNCLTVYHYGERLFVADKDTVGLWIFIVENLLRVENTYLYNEETLSMEYGRTNEMFSILSDKIQSGCTPKELEAEWRPGNFVPTTLSDGHCIDVWHSP